MIMTINEVARRLGGMVEGDGTGELHGVAGLAEAGAGDLSFLSNPHYSGQVATTRAAAVIVPEDFQKPATSVLIRVKNPDRSFAEAALWFAPPPVIRVPGIHPTAVIAADARLGKDVFIGPYVVIESKVEVGDRTQIESGCHIAAGCAIGADCHFYPLVSLREYVRVGQRVILHNGVVLGSDGFGYSHDGTSWKKIPQIGIVEVGDDVEIGANTTVDRARFGVTRIERGVKIDNLVQIAHNVTVGEHSALAAQVGVSGSSHVGKRVRAGGQVGIAGHLAVGDDVVIGAQSGVTKDVRKGSYVFGTPAAPHEKIFKIHAHMMRLPELKDKVTELQAKITELEERINGMGRV